MTAFRRCCSPASGFAVPWAVTIVCSRRACRRTGRVLRIALLATYQSWRTRLTFSSNVPTDGDCLERGGHTTSDADGAFASASSDTTPERPGYATTNATALGSVGARPRDAGRQMVRRAISRRGTSVDPRARSGGARHALYEGVRYRRCQQRRHRHRRVEPGRHNRR